MAIVLRGMSKCSICGVVIQEDDEIVATTHFISNENDPLWRFSDSAMHKPCFLDWEHKDNFVKKYNETIGDIIWGNGTFHKMENDGHISVLKKDS